MKHFYAPNAISVPSIFKNNLPKIFLGILLMLAGMGANAQYSQVPVTGGSYNSDVVAEGTTNADASATSTDAVDGTATSSFVFVTSTFRPSAAGAACSAAGGFPGSITSSNTTTNTGITYTLPSATGNNALRLTTSGTTSGTMTFSSPTSASSLYLVCLGGNGASTFNVQVNFSDATTETITGLSAPDWCGGAATNKLPNATTPTQFYRVARNATTCTGALCQYLYELPVAISASNYAKTINSITITTTSATFLHVFAVGKQSPCAVPSAQATGLTQGATTSGSIAASFTAAAGLPAGYLIVRYPTGATATAPSNGTTYVANQSLGLGTVVQVGATTSFTASGLTGNTTYDFYVYSYNTAGTCGGPMYLTTSPHFASYATSACSGLAGGTYTVGPTGTYPSITNALSTSINAGITGPVVLELQAAYVSSVETFPITFPSNACIGPINTLIIRPETGATGKSITSSTGAGTINFNGANYVTIDGRPGGTGSTSQLSIAYTTAGTGYALNFTGDASNNTIKYCTVTSRANTATSGSITFGAGTITGNDNNTIDNCSITDDGNGTAFPANGIYSSGTSAAIDNGGNTVSNCNISNYFSATVVSSGILLGATGNSAWNISNNKFFQTANRTYTAALATLSAITIGVGGGYTISGNTIGYANSGGTGYTGILGITTAGTFSGASFPTSYTLGTATLNATRYIGINCAFTAGGTVSNIQGNTIGGIALLTSSGATTTYGILCGIQITSGNANVGTITANTIGSAGASLGSLYAATNTAGGTVVGIYATSANTVSIQNNNIGSIDASGTTNALCAGITAIDIAGAGSFTISSNSIGNSTAANLRNGFIATAGGTLANTSSASGGEIGIRAANTGATLAINSNTMRGFATSSSTTNTFAGITSTGAVTSSVTINNNFLGTAAMGLLNYTHTATAISGAFTGISCTGATAATVHSIQSNDFRGITYSGIAGTNAHNYITLTGATAANDVATISGNTFTNLNVNTTGSITFISHGSTVAATGTQTINNNSIITAYNKGGAGGTITLATSASGSLAGAIINHTNNNFSNITVTGATTIAGWISTDGGTANKNYTGNTFSNWTGGTSGITAMNVSFGGGNGGSGNVLSGNTISNITGQSSITGISLGSSGTTHTANNNTITGLSSTGAGGNVVGITSGAPTGNIFSNTINTLSSTAVSATVTGIAVTASSTATNVYSNTISGLSGSGTTSPVVTGIQVAAGSIVNVYKNQICNLSTSGVYTTTTTSVHGISLSGGTTVTAHNNIIGDLRATATSNGDAIRGISVSSTSASTTYNVYFNTIFLEAATSGTIFGTTGVYHAASSTATTAKLELRNNIIVNKSANVGGGVTSALRRSVAGTFGNWATTSNNNLYYVGTVGATNAFLNDNGTVYGTAAVSYAFGPATAPGTFQGTVAPREALSVTETVSSTDGVFFQSVVCGNANYLHLVPALPTQAEAGAISPDAIVYATDYDGETRAGSTGYTGPGTAPDIGADEFNGISPSPVISGVTLTPGGNQCAAVGHTVSATILPGTGTISGAVIAYSYNGTVQTPVPMTNTSGNIWSGVIPAATPTNATVAWGILATNSGGFSKGYSGTSYSDDPLFAITVTATATPSTICAGNSTTLNVSLPPAAIGTGTSLTSATTQPTAFCNRWGSYRMQIIYTAAELQAAGLIAGNITAMAFNINSLGDAATNSGFTVKIGNTTASTFTAFEPTTSFTTVFPSQTYTHTASGLQTISFATPFVWNGTSNINVEVIMNGANSINNSTTYYTATAGNTIAYTATTSADAASLSTNRLNIVFTGAGASAYSWSNGFSTVGNTSTLVQSPTTSTNYTASVTIGSCTKASNTVAVTVNPLPAAPTATGSSQCGIAIPTASVTSTSGAGTTPFMWYSASSGGTTLQTPPVAATLSTYYSNNFSSSSLNNSSIASAAAISGGVLALQPTATSTGGSLTVNASGINSTIFQTDFDLSVIASGASIADGFSYSIGDDAIPLNNSSTPTAEHGSGSKIRIAFLTFNTASGSDGKGIYLGYGVSAATGYTAGTSGMLGYSTNVSWIPSSSTINSHITITINAAGQLTLMLGATTIFNNVQLPAGYLSADKSTWKHIFSSRSGGTAGGFVMDNLVIQANGYATGYSTYQTSISATTTFYVTEKDATTGCESTPRTPVTASVSNGDAVAGVAQISGSNVTQFCLGSTFQLSTSQTGSNNNAYTYTWTASPAAGSGIAGSVSGGSFGSPITLNITPTAAGTYTYTVTYSDGVCNGIGTKTITVNPLPAVTTIGATPSTICAGSSTSLSATSLAFAAGTATIGAGSTTTSTYNAPFYSLWSNKHLQILITAAELTAGNLGAGNITSISFPTTVGTVSNKDYTIKMAHTTATNVSTFVTGGFTTVYTSAAQAQTAGTNNTITLATPFNWDGTSNLVIELCWGDNTTTATLSSTSPADATSYVSVREEHNTVATSGTSICGSTGSSSSTFSVRPQIIFGGQAITNVTASMNWLWNPGGLAGATVSASPAGTTTYTVTVTNPTTTCSNTGTTSVTVNPIPTAPTGANSTQCGPGIPTASVTSTSGAASPQFFWYSAASGGTAVQTPPFSNTLSTYYTNVFSSTTLTNASLSGAAAINVGSGTLILQPAVTSSAGGFTVNPAGYNSNQYQTDFDLSLTATATSMADGFSYSFADDALATTTTPTAEHGSGSKLRLGFFTFNTASGSDGKGIYLMYNVSATTGYTSSTSGVLAYSTDVSWIPTSATTVTSHVRVTINAAGQATVSVGGTNIFTNVQLPAGFLSADRSTWKHVFSSRSGGTAGGFAIDNLAIQSNTYAAGYTTYQTAISATTTYHVTEKDATTGCESSPRIAVTVTVTNGDVVTPIAKIGASTITSLCIGQTFQLTTSQAGGNNNAYNYSWTSTANSGITGSVSGGTFAAPTAVNVTPTAAGTYVYTITSNDGLCNDINTISITVNPLPVITSAVANPSPICAGVSSTLTAFPAQWDPKLGIHVT